MKTIPDDKEIQRNLAQKAIDAGRVDCPGIMLYQNFFRTLDYLTDEEAGRLIKAVSAHRYHAEEPDFSDRTLAIAYQDAKDHADRDLLAYALKTIKNAYVASGKRVADEDGNTSRAREDFEQWFERYLSQTSER